MTKRLQDMTLEELWSLFPIVLTPHSARWSKWAHEEIDRLSRLLSEYSPIINHIGSTAIPRIKAKPIVDILVEVHADTDLSRIKTIMEANGYLCMSDSENRVSFNKGYTPDGYAEKVFHIHVRRNGDNAEILFRDYLITHTEAAKEYERLKLSLLSKYKNNRDSYTDAKTEFVNEIIKLAESESGQQRAIS